jgi:hypothetical protein
LRQEKPSTTGEGEGDGRVEVRPADPGRGVHAQRDREAPRERNAVRNAVVVTRLTSDDLRDDTHPDQDEDHRPGELREHLAEELAWRIC